MTAVATQLHNLSVRIKDATAKLIISNLWHMSTTLKRFTIYKFHINVQMATH